MEDIICHICTYLPSRDKLHFVSTSHRYKFFLTKIFFTDDVEYNRIATLAHFDSFKFVTYHVNENRLRTPKNITHLKLESQDWRQQNAYIFDIPNTVTHLYARIILSPKIVIPQSVVYIDICRQCRNDPISIPTTVKELYAGYFFSQSLRGTQIAHLTLEYNFPCDFHIPSTVTHLTFGFFFDHKIANLIPDSVTHLTFGRKYSSPVGNHIPTSVTHLVFGNNYCKSIDDLPDSIVELELNGRFNKVIKRLPRSLKKLVLGDFFNKSIKNILPPSLTHLTIGKSFNQPIKNCIPASVTHLTIANEFKFFDRKKLPHTVVYVEIQNSL